MSLVAAYCAWTRAAAKQATISKHLALRMFPEDCFDPFELRMVKIQLTLRNIHFLRKCCLNPHSQDQPMAVRVAHLAIV